MNVKKKSEQKVMVYCDFSESDYQAIAHGIRISEIFQLQLCLFHSVEGKAADEKVNAQLRLSAMIKKLQPNVPQVSIASLCLKGKLTDTIRRLVDGFDGVLLVCSNTDLKKKMKALQESRIPFLFVGESDKKQFAYKEVLVPLDYRRVMKSSSLWGTYFARFNDAHVELLLANEKNESNKKKLELNVKSFEKIMNGFKLKAKYTLAVKSSFGLTQEALYRAKVQKSDLLIIPASQKVNFIDLWLGLPELKLVKQAAGLPVMCINPSHNMLVLCD